MIALAAAVLLLAAAVIAWFVALGARPASRVQLRFACVLFAAPAVARLLLPAAAPAILLLILPIALGVLVLATAAGFARVLRPSLAALLLGAVSLCAMGAAITGWSVLSLGPATLGAVALLALGSRSLQALAAALCFLGAICVFAVAPTGVDGAPLLFAAAGLLGLVLALSRSDVAVEERAGRDLRDGVAIRSSGA